MDTQARHGKTPGPPYMSWATKTNLLDRMGKDGVPGRIDRSVLSGSEGYKTQVLAGLRWLGLINQDGEVTPRLEELADPSGDRQKLIGELFRERYPAQIALGERNATQRELEESFKPYGGETARKAVSFYLQGAHFAGLPISKYWTVPKARKSSGAKGTSRRRTSRPASPVRNGGPGEDEASSYQGLHPALAGLLNEIPRNGKGWTQERRDAFTNALGVMLDFCVPITAEVEEVEAEEVEA